MVDPRLRTMLPCGVVLRDPLLLASGCCGMGEDYSEIFDPASIGGIVTKAVSLEPREGNAAPRLWETPAGLLNCIGLQNPGVKAFCQDVIPSLKAKGITFLVNVVGHTPGEFRQVIEAIEPLVAVNSAPHVPPVDDDGITPGFAGYELDLSCPNVASGTLFATDDAMLRETVSLCGAATGALIVAKLSPNVTDIVPFARAANEAGADAVTIANTWNGVSVDIATRKSRLVRPSAGLSGAAIRAATLYHVWRCHRALPELPIIGCGGITDVDSAVQYLLAGASALMVGTGLFLDPTLPLKLQAGISKYLDEQGEDSLAAIVGTYRDSLA